MLNEVKDKTLYVRATCYWGKFLIPTSTVAETLSLAAMDVNVEALTSP